MVNAANDSPWEEPEFIDETSVDEIDQRALAIKRSWVCPGSGFAMVGRRKLALGTFVAYVLMVLALLWLALLPSATAMWALLAAMLAGLMLWIVELILVPRVPLHPPGPWLLVEGFLITTIVVTVAALVAVLLLFLHFDTLIMSGSGMSPTIDLGEWLIYYRPADWDRVQPGRIILFGNPPDSLWGTPGDLMIARILAGPGDAIAIENGRYIVNGVAGPEAADTGDKSPLFEVPSSPASLKVPVDSYFIIQDAPDNPFDSRLLSWVHADQIISSRIWYLGGHGWFKELD